MVPVACPGCLGVGERPRPGLLQSPGPAPVIDTRVLERLRRLGALPATRVGKWVVLVAWLVILFAAFTPAGQFEDAQENESTSFLPGDAESTKVLEQLEQFQDESGEEADAVIVYARDGGLTAADRATIARTGRR